MANVMRRSVAAAAALAVLVTASSCSYRRPEIEVEGIELGSIGLSGGTVMVNLRVENPNPVGLRADQLRYELFVRAPRDSARNAWDRLSTGTYEEEIRIGANETRTVRIPVQFRYSELGTAGMSVLRSGRVDYRATGTVRVRAAGRSRTVPFRKSGTVMVLGGG